MIQGITITCFAASYAVALALEVSRLFWRLPVRLVVMAAFTIAGLLAHTLYLGAQARDELGGSVAPLSSWHDWCVMAAWVLAAAYLGISLRRPQHTVGLFVLPLVLALIGLAQLVRDVPGFSVTDATSAWRAVHGVALLLGTAAVLLGAAAGTMYLLQSFRLKRKLPAPGGGLRLPSLEWLQRFNKRALWTSMILLAVGLVSGVILNLIKHAGSSGGVAWTDLGVISSLVLFLWLAVAVGFEAFYRPARQGRKVAYLTIASLVFLVLALGFVLVGEHASTQPPTGRLPRAPRP